MAANYFLVILLLVMVLIYMAFMSDFNWFTLKSFEVVFEEVKDDGIANTRLRKTKQTKYEYHIKLHKKKEQ